MKSFDPSRDDTQIQNKQVRPSS